jgi:hypothetical protein
VLVCAALAGASGSSQTYGALNSARELGDVSTESYYANAHPYLEQPLPQIVKSVPELKHLQPAPDQQALPTILQKSGLRVDDFFKNIVDLIAHEKITQLRVDSRGVVTARQDTVDSYLIIYRGNEPRLRLDEYRMDSKGNQMEQVGLDEGYIITSGFAMSCIYFATVMQAHTIFRYLGEQRVDNHGTHVVAFAQRPSENDSAVDTSAQHRGTVHVLMQGIAWLDEDSFQIIRLRSDLLAPRPEIGLSRETTDVKFSEVWLRDIATPLWLPRIVNVYTTAHGHHFKNEHRYTDYQRYRASAKIVLPY